MTLPRRTFLGALGAATVAAACGTTPRRATAPSAALNPSPAPPSAPAGPSHSAAGPAREVDSGRRDRRLVALTFHGQGDPALAIALMNEAEKASSRLTIFAVGSWLVANPAIVQRIRSSGHELANHTQHHLPMAAMGQAQAYDEFARCAEVLHTLAGSPGYWARPSGTPHTTSALRAAAGRAGYRVCVGYDVDSLDYTNPGAAVVRRRVESARPGSIVSLHLGHPDTVAALPGILTDLAGRGLRPVTVTQLLGTP